MNSFSDLAGKRVVVTGACGVIGRWIAESLREAGADAVPDRRAHRPSSTPLARRSSACASDSFTQRGGPDGRGLHRRLWSPRSDGAGARPTSWSTTPGSIPAASCSTSATAEFDRIFAINLRAPFS